MPDRALVGHMLAREIREFGSVGVLLNRTGPERDASLEVDALAAAHRA